MTTVSSSNTVKSFGKITRTDREQLQKHRGAIVWFTGLSGAGKTTLIYETEAQLHTAHYRTFVLDGDNVRQGLCGDLGFSNEDRVENIRRVGEVAKLFMEAGIIVLAGFISPFHADRDLVRKKVEAGDFLEIYVQCPLEICEQRDVKGLYRLARMGKITDFTGISSPYEIPENPDLLLKTGEEGVEMCVKQVVTLIEGRVRIPLKSAT